MGTKTEFPFREHRVTVDPASCLLRDPEVSVTSAYHPEGAVAPCACSALLCLYGELDAVTLGAGSHSQAELLCDGLPVPRKRLANWHSCHRNQKVTRDSEAAEGLEESPLVGAVRRHRSAR